MSKIRILAFAGSLRAQSLNKKLVAVAAQTAREMDCEVDLIDLRDFQMPIYDGDDEQAHGQPQLAKDLKARILACDALLVGCPEYNASITAVLKNTIDWLSRPQPGEPSAFKGRPAALLAASLGPIGGLRGLSPVRDILTQLGVLTVPTQFALGSAGGAFDDDGNLIDPVQRNLVKDVLVELVTVTAALRAAR
ncbi:MAG: FMN-dependent NADPH-azoreductase [Pseudomonadota bacterium]